MLPPIPIDLSLYGWLEDFGEHSWGCTQSEGKTFELECLLFWVEEKVVMLRCNLDHKEGIFEVYFGHPIALLYEGLDCV